MTVLIYVNTSKQVGDPEHLKVFANATPPKNGSRKMTPKASLSSMRSWSESQRASDDPCHAVDHDLGDPLDLRSAMKIGEVYPPRRRRSLDRPWPRMPADLIVPTGDRNAFLVATNLYRVRFY